MKWLDEVRVTSDKYENRGIKKGDIGTIILSEIRELAFEVAFTYPGGYDDRGSYGFVRKPGQEIACGIGLFFHGRNRNNADGGRIRFC